ncbi:MAG: hypothetical protein Q4P25_01740 [Tissierellia bacterium]|nr:hypothetical protein [Tissierellia bacterium]
MYYIICKFLILKILLRLEFWNQWRRACFSPVPTIGSGSEKSVKDFDPIGTQLTFGKVEERLIGKIDGIIRNLPPQKMKNYIKEMSLHSREATDEARLNEKLD